MSVTAVPGFRAAGVACGIKSGGVLDLAVIAADAPGLAAAVFTVNRAAAAPVIVSKEHLAGGAGIMGIVANSGCANAATGAAGLAAARRMATVTASALGCDPGQILVASTGPIGPHLPMERLEAGIVDAVARLAATSEAATAAAAAIMTTDSRAKEVAVEGPGFKVGGMVKGAGMIRPDMATMLAFLTTDAAVEPDVLRAALAAAVDRSFHALNIDGCPSTNDTVAIVSTGTGAVPAPGAMEAALTEACASLARQMADDAEGASRVVRLTVSGAPDEATARRAGRLIADSALVRASFYGGDPNWGRLIGALGASPIVFDPDLFGISYQGVRVAANGVVVPFDSAALLAAMESGDLDIEVEMGDGPGRATVLTTDLTPDYVLFNGERS